MTVLPYQVLADLPAYGLPSTQHAHASGRKPMRRLIRYIRARRALKRFYASLVSDYDVNDLGI